MKMRLCKTSNSVFWYDDDDYYETVIIIKLRNEAVCLSYVGQHNDDFISMFLNKNSKGLTI